MSVELPYTGQITEITMLNTGCAVPFREGKDAVVVTPPKWDKEKSPIARVYCIKSH